MMITCPECKKEYSDQAKTCVHCGAKNPNKMSGGGKFGIFLLILIGLFIAFVVISKGVTSCLLTFYLASLLPNNAINAGSEKRPPTLAFTPIMVYFLYRYYF